MAARFPRGQQEWEGFVQLAEPLQLMGVDRKAFFLCAIFSYVIYMTAGFMLGAGVFILLLGFFRYIARIDPHIITVAQAAFKYTHAWYDYDSPPSPDHMGPIIDPPPDDWPHGRPRSF